MKKFKRAYLSIGSNQGEKYENLQKTVDRLNQQAGHVVASSKIYTSPAWGFESDDFLNACLAIDTTLNPEELLKVMLKIEESLGRVRSDQKGYAARTIDIDIIFYEDEIIDTSILKVPHPYLELRKFVLLPLADIAPNKIHPKLNKSVTELLQNCKDDSALVTYPKTLRVKKNDFSKFKLLAIEGNIGAGKTTLATKIADDFNGKLILERFADNPFLPKFYNDMQRYAFSLEMSFLADRYQQFTDDTSQFDLFKDFMVSDYDIFKSLVFAKVTLHADEFTLYRKIFNFMYKEVIKPDVYVYLYQNTDRLLENIKKRGRNYEQKIAPEYLESINRAYLDYIKTHETLNSLVIDVSEMDFVKREDDYHLIVDQIHDFYNER
ncbi:2-amino-4-hydroxy-6-hydroxymethyldihydropteridine diphosphokinase [Zhouia amylolytica]|uniref:2-amino-4-hydroxy-6- hydroxymethyldihydropteridine diphosphokinase n=1 Tax=Zhouia amylolytica TaxID=376730 RepID=UPI0020CCD4BD|nr:2-amino-4-hydroxy-6-hydroxymethyldihydropteridine diphosphokinase [Zhouia amylolytica]MCQ0110438.1 2-amino-4-hydroxy-6-hydroxymethyldihydropteridine diphosphokinase [Zhouia amylolytica]